MKNVCLKSQKFHEDLGLSLQRFRADGDFSDVTLVSGDGEQFEAHRVVLASFSSVFETIFKGNRRPHPLVYMRGVKSSLLGHVLMFLYQGEVDLPEDGVNDLLDFANEFNINGLAAKPDTTAVHSLEKPEDHNDDSKVVHFSEVDEKLRHIFKSEDPHHLDDEIEIDANARKGEKWQRIDRKRKKSSQILNCQNCDFTAPDKWHINRHTMAKHVDQPTTACLVTSCKKSFESVDELKEHKETCYMQCTWPACNIRFLLKTFACCTGFNLICLFWLQHLVLICCFSISLIFSSRFRLPQSFEAHKRKHEGKVGNSAEIKLENSEKLKKLWETIKKA